MIFRKIFNLKLFINIWYTKQICFKSEGLLNWNKKESLVQIFNTNSTYFLYEIFRNNLSKCKLEIKDNSLRRIHILPTLLCQISLAFWNALQETNCCFYSHHLLIDAKILIRSIKYFFIYQYMQHSQYKICNHQTLIMSFVW